MRRLLQDCCVLRRPDGSSRGFGFVTFDDEVGAAGWCRGLACRGELGVAGRACLCSRASHSMPRLMLASGLPLCLALPPTVGWCPCCRRRRCCCRSAWRSAWWQSTTSAGDTWTSSARWARTRAAAHPAVAQVRKHSPRGVGYCRGLGGVLSRLLRRHACTACPPLTAHACLSLLLPALPASRLQAAWVAAWAAAWAAAGLVSASTLPPTSTAPRSGPALSAATATRAGGTHARGERRAARTCWQAGCFWQAAACCKLLLQLSQCRCAEPGTFPPLLTTSFLTLPAGARSGGRSGPARPAPWPPTAAWRRAATP